MIKSIVVLTLVCSLMPQVTLAAEKRPVCDLTATIHNTPRTLKNKTSLVLPAGTAILINWDSKNAQTAYDYSKQEIGVTGSTSYTITKNNTLRYTFVNKRKKTDCAVSIEVARGTIATKSISNVAGNSTLKGTVKKQKKVMIQLQKIGDSKPVFTSSYTRVKNGKWSIKLPSKLTDGEYVATLIGDKRALVNIVATSTLTLGNPVTPPPNLASNLIVQVVPLLIGGVARTGTSVPIAYLQLINIGTATATIRGFTIQQVGTASTDAIVSLTASDDTGLYYGSTGTTLERVQFVNNIATIPITAYIAPQATRLYTLKATTQLPDYGNVGKQLKLNVIDVLSSTPTRANFPLYGTTWTLSQ